MAKTVKQDAAVAESSIQAAPRWRTHLLRIGPLIGFLVVVLIALVIGFNLAYHGRILPGVSADGLYVGGLSATQAEQNVQTVTAGYLNSSLAISYDGVLLHTTPAQIGTSYNVAAATQTALAYGRQGGLFSRLHQQLRALLHRPTAIASLSFDANKLSPVLQQIGDAVAVPVSNAQLSATTIGATVAPSQAGSRLDQGLLITMLTDHLGQMGTSTVVAPVQPILPVIDTASLQAVAKGASTFLSSPITLNLPNLGTRTIPTSQIASWIGATRTTNPANSTQQQLQSYYPYATTQQPVTIELNPAAVEQYVSSLAASVNKSPVNAQLTVNSGNQVSVFVPSSNGYQLDQSQALQAITTAVKATGAGRTVAVNVTTIPPAVSEANLNSLGINQLISEGATTFPEGPADRLQNISTGAAKFNNVLIAPGQTFSFNTILGPVDAAHGFDSALVIANGTVTTADGGGLCQVSTTMYRAALLAGLPITARTNHSFVVSYYTSFSTTNLFGPNAGQSYSADTPGLDATIYLPDPDLQFTNDTGHYILIQEVLGYGSLKFDFYGTATKYGVIRGPYWTSSSHNTEDDDTQTTFYRDVYNMSGVLEHTDTVVTNYLPAAEFGE